MLSLEDLLKDVDLPPPEPPPEREPGARCPFCGGPWHAEYVPELFRLMAELIRVSRRLHPENREACPSSAMYEVGAKVAEVKRILDADEA